MSTLASDNFNRANSGTLGANWTDLNGGWGVVSNQASTATNGSLAAYTGVSFPNDQWCQATLKTIGTGSADAIGVSVRSSSAANGDAYFAFGFSSGSVIWKRISGGYTTLSSDGTAWSVSDVLYLEDQATTLLAKRNGSTLSSLTVTDSSLASGSAGVSGFYSGTGALDDLSAGDFSGGGGAIQQRNLPLLGVGN